MENNSLCGEGYPPAILNPKVKWADMNGRDTMVGC